MACQSVSLRPALRWPQVFLLASLLWVSASGASVTPVPDSVRARWELDPFYQKYIPVRSLPILGSSKVSDFALLEAAYLVQQVTAHRPELLDALATNQAKIVIMAHNEYTTDLPEQRHMEPKTYWDSRARGLGGRTCSGAEENLLAFPGDPYSQENILIHEFAHVLHGQALRRLDPTFDPRLKQAYERALAQGLWRGTYAATDRGEYWAEGVQNWFDDNRHNDALHNHVHTRAQLKEYDPELARLCAEVLGDLPWRYRKPMNRPPEERAHLAGFDPKTSPRFQWRAAPIPDRPRVVFETARGSFEVELDAKAAPRTVTNFLHYVHHRLYNDGLFFRTVTAANQPDDPIKIAVVQARAGDARAAEFLPPVPLERTRDTGLRHLDGTISMARAEPDTATHHFFICIGDQPDLDFGGRRNPDGQGFAAFGRVVRGMDLIRQIHASPAEGQVLTPPVEIQRAVRLN